MPDTAWKKWERKVAADFGGYRTGPRGFNLPDVSGVPAGLECKLQQNLSLRKQHLDQAKNNAEKLGLPWALVLKERKGPMVIVVDYAFGLEMYNAWKDTQTKEREMDPNA